MSDLHKIGNTVKTTEASLKVKFTIVTVNHLGLLDTKIKLRN